MVADWLLAGWMDSAPNNLRVSTAPMASAPCGVPTSANSSFSQFAFNCVIFS